MPPRARQSTFGPTQKRPGNELPPYEKPAFALNPGAQRALAQLNQTHSLKKLDERLQEAQGALSTAAIDINERVTSKEQATKKRRDLQSSQEAETGGNDALEQELENLRDRVERMTQRMDESMRKMVDGRHGAQGITDAIESAATDARMNASTQVSTQNVQSQRQRRRVIGADEDEEDDDNDDEYQDFTPTDPTGGTQVQRSPLEMFRTQFEDAKIRYQNYSFTARYANDNDYRDFRRGVHFAKYPNEDVALPPHSEWFKEQEAPAPGVTTRAREDANGEDEDDIAVSKATVSTKCPLTLMEFKNPLTSTKCPHSFESEAILSVINGSTTRVNPRGERYVQCPVGGCSQMLTRGDLHKDNALIRKIQRIQRSKELEDEEMEEDDAGGNGRVNDTSTVIEDDGADVDDIVEGRVIPQTQMKREQRSTSNTAPPAPTAPPSSTAVVDLGSESDEDEANGDVTIED